MVPGRSPHASGYVELAASGAWREAARAQLYYNQHYRSIKPPPPPCVGGHVTRGHEPMGDVSRPFLVNWVEEPQLLPPRESRSLVLSVGVELRMLPTAGGGRAKPKMRNPLAPQTRPKPRFQWPREPQPRGSGRPEYFA